MDEEEITTCSNSAIEWNEISREIQVNGITNTIDSLNHQIYLYIMSNMLMKVNVETSKLKCIVMFHFNKLSY